MRIGLAPIRYDKMGGGQVGMVETALTLLDAGHQVWMGGYAKMGVIGERLRKAPFQVCQWGKEVRKALRGTDIIIAPAKLAHPLADLRPAINKVPCIIVALWTMGFYYLKSWTSRSTGLPYHAIWIDSYLAGKDLDSKSPFAQKYRKLYSPIPLHPARFEQDFDVDAIKRSLKLNTRLVLGNVARHVGGKGIARMITLWENCPEEASLLLVGGGKYHSAFKSRARKYDQICTVGYVGDDTMYIAAMDIFLHLPWRPKKPANVGTVAIAPCEAMMMGKPVIATRADFGWSEQFKDGETGFVVRNDAEILQRTIQLLKDDGLRERLGASAREFMVRNNEKWRENLLNFIDLIEREGV